MAATRAFREGYTATNPLAMSEDFSTWDGRRLRYAIYWAMYEKTAYRNFHTWAQGYKTTFALYRFIRSIESPTTRLGDFWQAHLWGGLLDMAAGDGKQVPSALPIITETEDDKLRKAIAKVWEWSYWQTEKDIVTLRGAVMGDSFIKVMDDDKNRRVYLKSIHPGTIKELDTDTHGNVKEYVLEEQRPHPVNGKPVAYREEATRDGDNVVYKTYLNDSPFAWNGEAAEYALAYTFTPLVFIQHRNVGLPWGWSELHSGMSNFREVDDQASLLSDQIRKNVNSAWFFSGVSAGTGNASITTGTPDTDNPEGGREEMPALYGPAGSSATALVSPLDITAAAAHIDTLLSKIEQEYPELSDTLENAQGDISGRALRINRQPVIDRVQHRRPNYDTALVRAQQMAIAIAGWRGYDAAFSGFDLNSFKAGKLNHSIGDRPVFAKDPLDEIEVDQAFWTAANAAKTAGGMTAMTMFFRKSGWSEEQIGEFVNSEENQARLEAVRAGAAASKSLSSGEFMPARKAQNPDGKQP